MNDDTYFLFGKPGPALRKLTPEDKNLLCDIDASHFTTNAMRSPRSVAHEVLLRIGMALHSDIVSRSSATY